MLHVYDVTLQVGSAPSPRHDAGFVAGAGRHRCTCSSKFPRASFPIRIPTRLLVDHRSRAGHFVLPDGASTRRQIARRVRQDPERRSAHVDRRRRHRLDSGRPQLRPARGPPEAAQRAQTGWSSEMIEDLRPKLSSDPRHARLPAESADHPHRRPGHQEPVSVLPAVAGQEGTVRRGRQARRTKSTRSPACEDVTSDSADHAARRSTSPSIATRPPPCRSTPTQIENALLRRLRPALGLHHLRAGQRIQGAAGTRSRSIRPIRTPVAALFQDPTPAR